MINSLRAFFLLLAVASPRHNSEAYSIGDVDPRALRGVWRLTSLDKDGLPFEKRRLLSSSSSVESDPREIWRLRGFLPMKEFTTYPKKKSGEKTTLPTERKQTEIFIKLKDDQTFEQCKSLLFSDGEESETMEERLAAEILKRERESFAWKGTWDFVDGKLILAADRPEKKPFFIYDEEENTDKDGNWKNDDTILVGKVSVHSEQSLTDNPAMEKRQMLSDESDSNSQQNAQQEGSSHKQSPKKQSIDVYLSVPKGKIKTGKFMYPKHHPSFFEQPIFNPRSMGNFELKQILGDYNARVTGANPNGDDDDMVELFRKDDLVGKRFYLSTYPLPKRKKTNRRGQEVKDEDESQPQKNMQVVAVELFANNTFSTVYGLGSSTVLRGKWSIIGEKRDQIWIQVYRFGFGRSVSYGTFSEGMSLTQDDEKAYWGKITQVDTASIENTGDDCARNVLKKIEIDGAVMVGWGLEPCSVGRFKMIEIEEEISVEEEPDETEEDEDYVEMSENDVKTNANSFELLLDDANADDNLDLFDVPGAFD
ncbi:hypothetical protein HJC23_005772 [Cyclotella cryptica]|uniref:Uncharacterized protein n=1 Tax=Cyclotella cryptica TaxID=29204 RepID=A0ABD3NWK5_9STRA